MTYCLPSTLSIMSSSAGGCGWWCGGCSRGSRGSRANSRCRVSSASASAWNRNGASDTEPGEIDSLMYRNCMSDTSCRVSDDIRAGSRSINGLSVTRLRVVLSRSSGCLRITKNVSPLLDFFREVGVIESGVTK